MRSILVCTDGSPYARTALQYARYLADAMSLRVKVLFIEDIRHTQGPLMTGYYGPVGMAPSPAYPAFYEDLVKAVQDQGRRAIADARAVFEGAAVEVEYVIGEGIVRDCILAEAQSADLLCLGRRGEHDEWEGDELGNTVSRVLRKSIRPVLVTPKDFKPFSRMLVAYDGSKGANRSLRAALALASDRKLPMLIATVVHKATDRRQSDAVLAQARELAAAWKEVAAECRLVEGDETERTLLELAASESCDLIVMGAYGDSRIREWLLGSTTSGVLARSDRPVLLVR